jgi:flagellar protein FlaJ
MRITNKQIRKVSIASTIAGIAFFVIMLIYYWLYSPESYLDPALDYMVVIALTIAIAPPSMASILHNRWQSKIERATPEFLRDIATASKTGIPLQVALEHASKRNYGPLTDELKLLVAHMSWGKTFEEALTEFSDRIDLPLIKKATVLMNTAGTHGGDLSNIFEATADYVENMNSWANKRRMQTLPYVAIFYFSVFIFLFIIIIISNMMFGPMSQLSNNGVSIIQPVLTTAESRRVFLHTALLESVFGGLIAGKINEDTFTGGLKHAMILCIASGVAFYLFFH